MNALLYLPVIMALTGQSIFAQNIDTIEIKSRIDSLIRLADSYNSQSDNDKALEVIREAEALQLDFLATGTILHGEICHLMGRILKEQGDFSVAEKYIMKAMDIRELSLGKDHVDYLKSLGNLGILYFEIGDYDQSEPLLLEVVSGVGRLEDWVLHSQVLNSLGNLYLASGNYRKCEMAYLQALDYWEREGILEHPFYLGLSLNLSSLYLEMGNLEKAERILLRYFDIQEIAVKPNFRAYAVALTNMSKVYAIKRDTVNEEAMLLKCLSIEQQIYESDHPELGATLGNLGNFYMRIGRYDEAERYLKDGLRIVENAFGPVSEASTKNRMILADLARAKEDFDVAQALYQETRNLIKLVHHPRHEMNREICRSLTSFYYDRYEYGKAMSPLLELTQFSQELIRNASKHLSIGEMERYLSSFQQDDNLLYSILYDLGKQVDFGDMINQLSGLGFDMSLTRKMYLMLTERQLLAFSNDDSLLSSKFEEFKSLQKELTKLYTSSDDNRDKIETLSERANKLEKDLMISSSDFRAAGTQVTWDSLQKELDASEIVIEFVHFKYQNDLSDSILYAALMLGPGYQAPRFIPLFEERQLLALLDSVKWGSETWRAQKDKDNWINLLDDLIWSPLEPYLAEVLHIHYSPSGLLHRIPLVAISSKNGRLLGDRFTFHQLGSTRQLYVNRNYPAGDSTTSYTASVFGGIHYEMDSTAILSANQNLVIKDSTDMDLLGAGLRASIQSGMYESKGWTYLPWTEVESKIITGIVRQQGIKVDLFSGFQATEDNLHYLGVNKPSPRILHIATHGYFFPDPGNDPAAGSLNNEPAFKISEHPLIRSGLIMAGANLVWTGGKPLRNLEDGILTAYEVSQMDLSETELVVLSACETGLGDIRGDEGVYGLQRAFKIAGARYLIMSLWQVPDFTTQELMTLFYTNWLKEKMELPEAFRKSQETVRSRRPDPFYWAGFVLVE